MFDLLSNLSSGGQAKVDGSQTTMGKTSAGKSIGGGTSDFSQWLNLSPEQQQQAGQNLPLMPGIASQEGLKAPAQFGFLPQLTAEEVASQNLLQDQASDFLSPQTFGQIVTAESAGLSPQPAANSAMSDTLALGEWAHGEKPQNLLQQKPAGLPILASENGSLAAVGPENLSVSPLSAPRGGEAAALAKRPQPIDADNAMARAQGSPKVNLPQGAQGDLAVQDKQSNLLKKPVEVPAGDALAMAAQRQSGKPQGPQDQMQRASRREETPMQVDLAAKVPAIAFMTGHLEHLSPQQIPDLVASNRFIQGAMTEGDVAAFMDKPQPAGQILVGLDLPRDVAKHIDLSKAGLNPNQLISPKELLNLMGVDYQRVTAELIQLKDNLATDGLSPYLVRAAAMRQQQAPAAGPMAAPVSQKPLEMADVAAHQQKSPYMGQDGLGMTPASESRPQAAAPLASSQMSYDHFGDLTNAIRQDGNAVKLDMSQMQPANSASPANVLKTPGGGQPLERTLETMVRQFEPKDLPRLEKTDVSLSQKNAAEDMGLGVLGKGQADTKGGSQSDSQQSAGQFSHEPMMEHLLADRMRGSSLAQTADRFAAELERPSEVDTPQNLQQIIDRISDRTFMAVKEGGGLVRLDMKHAELGNLDLAIDVQQSKVDLRILAGSEAAKEILTGEMPTLREALGTQQISLGDVEIGVKEVAEGQQSGSQFAQEFGDNTENAAQDFADRSEILNSFDRLRQDGEPLAGAVANAALGRGLARHNGSIQTMA